MGEEGYTCGPEEEDLCIIGEDPVELTKRVWWRLGGRRVLGVMNGMLLDFDKPYLGLVIPATELMRKVLAVFDSGLEE